LPVTKETPMPFPPIVWVCLGILYVILGVIQSFFAALWRWWFGVALGFGCAKTGSSLIGIGLTGAKMPYTCFMYTIIASVITGEALKVKKNKGNQHLVATKQ
jgi:hypothetical protein